MVCVEGLATVTPSLHFMSELGLGLTIQAGETSTDPCVSCSLVKTLGMVGYVAQLLQP